MIITVTMNPAIDKTAEAETISPGCLNRLRNVTYDAGGKGVNVSKILKALGVESVATGFLGGGAGREIEARLLKAGIKSDFVSIGGTTRTNLKVLTKEFGITEFNEPGAEISASEMDALREKLLCYAGPDATFVLSGSLPRGVGADIYFRLIYAVKEKGASVFLDADGEAFKAAVEAKPDYIKPNLFELKQYFGLNETEMRPPEVVMRPLEAKTPQTIDALINQRSIDTAPCSLPTDNTPSLHETPTSAAMTMLTASTLKNYASLCRRFTDKGIRIVTLSMGRHGALFVTDRETLYAPGLPVEASSTVGAGDCMVGALAYAFERKMNLREAAALAIAASAGAITTHGTKPPDRDTVESLTAHVKLVSL